MICVLEILAGPAAGKRIWLKENQCLEIGRMSSADFSIPADHQLSRRHMLIDSTGNTFRVRDIGSSNGTYLNNQRIDVRHLHDGDLIRAGGSTFSVSILESGENPHKLDGTSFGKTIAQLPKEPAVGTMRTLDFSDSIANGEGERTIQYSVEAEKEGSEIGQTSFVLDTSL
ncbi:MAG: FHA domain-containing protein, partial [Pirellula sp.]